MVPGPAERESDRLLEMQVVAEGGDGELVLPAAGGPLLAAF